ncbi:nucleotidyltransferase domain-containing protein [Nocardioides sp. TF02-7]|uniref:nucleotidyltransferase family protein n=1 Tax=Nocardioides sp. TF02-7 TaxID=2917724 RepID=UPI001F0567C1|nr:nucleotidyltransferase domain-containing protein [Nocardioides sp. TF02-7]UMG94859.1 nucleotidyltransferase domain-containing protein [Nocardioides sp. TF02-7]
MGDDPRPERTERERRPVRAISFSRSCHNTDLGERRSRARRSWDCPSCFRRVPQARDLRLGRAPRGQGQDSDIDLLVEAPEGSSSYEFIRFEQLLERVLGRQIDLVEYGGLKPKLDDDVRRTRAAGLEMQSAD